MTLTEVRPDEAAACRDGYLSSGPSPTRMHVLGAGQVARALLRAWEPQWRLVCLSDTSGSVHDAAGLDPVALADFKQQQRLAAHPRGRAIPLDTVLDLVDADVVVDCRSSTPRAQACSSTIEPAERILARGRRLVLAEKTTLAEAPWLIEEAGEALGFDAALAGAGRSLQAEREPLRAAWSALACVPNASTSAVLDDLARGRSLEQACARAQEQGLLESDPRSDLEGIDAALKLAVVASALGDRRVDWRSIERPVLDRAVARRAAAAGRRGHALRLVGRVRRGESPSLAYETVRPGSLLCPGPARVVYVHEQRDGGRRVHLGRALGPERTAAAVRGDLRRLAGRSAR